MQQVPPGFQLRGTSPTPSPNNSGTLSRPDPVLRTASRSPGPTAKRMLELNCVVVGKPSLSPAFTISVFPDVTVSTFRELVAARLEASLKTRGLQHLDLDLFRPDHGPVRTDNQRLMGLATSAHAFTPSEIKAVLPATLMTYNAAALMSSFFNVGETYADIDASLGRPSPAVPIDVIVTVRRNAYNAARQSFRSSSPSSSNVKHHSSPIPPSVVANAVITQSGMLAHPPSATAKVLSDGPSLRTTKSLPRLAPEPTLHTVPKVTASPTAGITPRPLAPSQRHSSASLSKLRNLAYIEEVEEEQPPRRSSVSSDDSPLANIKSGKRAASPNGSTSSSHRRRSKSLESMSHRTFFLSIGRPRSDSPTIAGNKPAASHNPSGPSDEDHDDETTRRRHSSDEDDRKYRSRGSLRSRSLTPGPPNSSAPKPPSKDDAGSTRSSTRPSSKRTSFFGFGQPSLNSLAAQAERDLLAETALSTTGRSRSVTPNSNMGASDSGKSGATAAEVAEFLTAHGRRHVSGDMNGAGGSETLKRKEKGMSVMFADDDGMGDEEEVVKARSRAEVVADIKGRRARRRRVCWTVWGCVAVLLAGLGLAMFFLWPRQPGATFQGWTENAANAQVNVGSSSDGGFILQVNADMRFLFTSQVWIPVTTKSIDMSFQLLDPVGRSVPNGNFTGFAHGVVLQPRASTNVTVPSYVTYTQSKAPKTSVAMQKITSFDNIVALLCELVSPGTTSLVMSYEMNITVPLYSWMGFHPTLHGNAAVPCPTLNVTAGF